MGSPINFNIEDFLQQVEQNQAAANPNNNAELADLDTTQLGALDQILGTETTTVGGAGGAGGTAVGGDSSADGTGVGGDAGDIRLDGNQNVNFGSSQGGAGVGIGGVSSGGDADASGGDGGTAVSDVDRRPVTLSRRIILMPVQNEPKSSHHWPASSTTRLGSMAL